MTFKVTYEQHPNLFDYINTKLKNGFNPNNSQLISQVVDEQIAAVIAYHSWMKHSVEMSIAAEPSKWATRYFIQCALDYPFFQEGKEKVIATVLTTNTASIEMLNRLGFSNEGCLKDYQGVDKDCFIYGLTKRQYLASRLAPKERIQEYAKNKN